MNILRTIGHLLLAAGLAGLSQAATPAAPAPANPDEAALSPAGKEFLAWCRSELTQAGHIASDLKAKGKTLSPMAALERYNELLIHLVDPITYSGLYPSVHPDTGMVKAGETCEQEANRAMAAIDLDRELFDVLSGHDYTPLKTSDPMAFRFAERVLRDFRRAGVNLPPAERDALKTLRERETEVAQQFERNIREDTRFIEIRDPARLAGLPSDFIESHKPDAQGVIRVSTVWTDYFPVIAYAQDEALRREMHHTYLNLAYPSNEPVLKELLTIRYDIARRLGYESYAHYTQEELMIGSPTNAWAFIRKIADLSRPGAVKEKAALLARKQALDPKAKDVNLWDREFLWQKIRQERFAVDPKETRRYFESDRVIAGILDLSQKMFGIRFAPSSTKPWHPSVKVFDVIEGGKAIGRIYLDLYPRPDKFNWMAMFSVVVGIKDRRIPEGAIVANFPEPKEGRPALMEHDDVVTMFHEFGHLLHYVLSGQQKWVLFSGDTAERDFVEVPSQFLEEWAWDYDTLKGMAIDEKGQTIPRDLVERMRKANALGRSLSQLGSMLYSAVALSLYEKDPRTFDLHKDVEAQRARYTLFPPPVDTHMEYSFGHLNWYASNLYTYTWSLVIAKDLFSLFKQKGMGDAALARRFRQSIFEPGASRKGVELVRDFMGRDFEYGAYERWLAE